MTLRNYADLTRGERRWLNLGAAFDVTAEYLGTFTLDQLQEKASREGKWISAVQYRRAGQRIDETALATVLSQSFLALAISLSVAYIFFLPEAAQVRTR